MADVETDAMAGLFREAAELAIDFRRNLPQGLQRPLADYGAMLRTLAGPTPEAGLEGPQVIAELAETMTPGLHAMAGSRFFGWVIGASHPVGVAADWLTSAWGQNCGNHQAAPAAAAAEAVAADWLVDLLRLPAGASVGFVTGATVANLVCLAAARSEVLARAGWDVEANGLFGAPPIRVLIGDDAHTTVFSALQTLGLGHDRNERIATDRDGRIDAAAFTAALDGHQGPLIAVLQAGQINTGAFDPFAELIPLVHRHGGWVHVDGAFGLWARAGGPEIATQANGVEAADSWATDGHKWLQTPYDCGYAIVRDSRSHRRAMTALASYLPEVADGERDPSHFVPELSRRARGFPTFALIRHFGRQGIAAMVDRHCRLARQLAERLAAEPGVAIENTVVLNQIAVRFGADLPPEQGDALTKAVIARLQADGTCFAGGARWRGRWIMRLSLIGWAMDDEAIEISLAAILSALRNCPRGRAWKFFRAPCRSRLSPFDVSVRSSGGRRSLRRPPELRKTRCGTCSRKFGRSQMRQVVAATFVSLDGVMQAPGGPHEDPQGGFSHGGWTFHYWDEAMGKVMDKAFTEEFDLLLGRRTYDIFAAHWPYAGDDPIAVKFNAITKYVATSEPQSLTWQNSVALRGDPAAEVAALKRQDGPKLLLQGSSELIQALLAKDLIDEITLLTFPVVLGKGKRLFGKGAMPAAFKLIESSASSTGVLMATYRREGEVTTGSFEFAEPSAAEIARREKYSARG